jgi:hypothetical protein
MEYSKEFTTTSRVHTPHFTYICDVISNYYRSNFSSLDLSIRRVKDNHLFCGEGVAPALHFILEIKIGEKIKASVEKDISIEALEKIVNAVGEKFQEQ